MTHSGRSTGPSRRRARALALILCLPWLALAQAPSNNAQDDAIAPGPAVRALPEIELSPQILYQVLAAEIAAQRGEIGSAAATFLSLARRTRDPRLAQRATEMALGARAPDRALTAARLWVEIEPTSRLAAQMVETLQISTGALGTVEPALRARLERSRSDGTLAQAYESLQAALLQAPDKKQALALIDRLAEPDRSVATARLAVAALAAAAGLPERAATEAAEAVRLAPLDENTAVLAARHAARTKNGLQQAISALEQFVARQPKALEARFTLARLLVQADRGADARAQFEAALAQEPDNPAILFSLAQVAAQANQNEAARSYLQRYLDLPPEIARDNPSAMLFMGQIAEGEGRTEDAIGWYARVESGEQTEVARARRAILLGRLKRVDEARALLAAAPARDARARTRLIMVESQILREAGRSAEAFKVLDDALARAPDDTDLLYDHAMAAERIDRSDVLEASLRKLIEARPDHAHAYNALGYTLADRNIRLDEARQLIERALELSPDDAHILDSMGWVLFRRGDLEGAQRYLRKAYALRPDVEIAVHLGEVLWKSGMHDEARQFWRQAREREPGNEVLRETLSRLNVSP